MVKELEKRYEEAIKKIGILKLLDLPQDQKLALQQTKDLETKVKILEYIAHLN